MKKLGLALLLLTGTSFAQDAVTTIQQAITATNQTSSTLATALAAAQSLQTKAATLQDQTAALQAQVVALQAQVASLQPAPQSVTGMQGVVNYYELMQGPWDTYINSGNPTTQAWMKANLSTAASFTPFFDKNLPWLPNTQVYLDSLAIYNPAAPGFSQYTTATQHPEWIATDINGNKLYIPSSCSAGVCSEYLADVTNAAWRTYMVGQILAYVKPGYTGVFLDDVNMYLGDNTVSNNLGAFDAPKDPKTGAAMTATAWEAYVVAYLQQLRSAVPALRMTHNSVWGAGSPATNSYVLSQMLAADLINFERGFGDNGVTGGTGQWSLGSLMSFIRDVHQSAHRSVNIMEYFGANEGYSLPCYFLVQEVGDSIGFMDETYGNWDPLKLYGVNLGAAKGPHFWNAQGVWERDFAKGVVYVNEPGASTKTLAVPIGLHAVGGGVLPQVTLQAKQGVILVSN